MQPPARIAVLFDGDNANPKYVQTIVGLVSGFGQVVLKKVYADWSMVSPKKWINPSLIHHIKPEQVFNFNYRKNASDFALLADALEMAFKKEVDTICIVSSDSDFIEVIMRLRKYNVQTIVIGSPAASMSLVTVCDVFIDERTLPSEKVSVRINSQQEKEETIPKSIRHCQGDSAYNTNKNKCDPKININRKHIIMQLLVFVI